MRIIRLIKNLYLDVATKYSKIEIPSEKVIWVEILPLEWQGEELLDGIRNSTLDLPIKKSKDRVQSAFVKLKTFCLTYLESLKGAIYLDQVSKNEMTAQILDAVNFMLCHGFYESQDELLAVASPVINILNGSNDIAKSGTSDNIGIKRYFES